MLWYAWSTVEGESGVCGPFESMSNLEDAISDHIQEFGDIQVTCFSLNDENVRPELVELDINELCESVTW
jgi:hypothetical protein